MSSLEPGDRLLPAGRLLAGRRPRLGQGAGLEQDRVDPLLLDGQHQPGLAERLVGIPHLQADLAQQDAVVELPRAAFAIDGLAVGAGDLVGPVQDAEQPDAEQGPERGRLGHLVDLAGEGDGLREVAAPRRHVALGLEEGDVVGIAAAILADHGRDPVIELALAVGLARATRPRPPGARRPAPAPRPGSTRPGTPCAARRGAARPGRTASARGSFSTSRRRNGPLGVLLGLGLDERQRLGGAARGDQGEVPGLDQLVRPADGPPGPSSRTFRARGRASAAGGISFSTAASIR